MVRQFFRLFQYFERALILYLFSLKNENAHFEEMCLEIADKGIRHILDSKE